MVVFWKWLDKEDEETGEVKQIPFLRYYNVFHIEQCEGIKAKPTMIKPNLEELERYLGQPVQYRDPADRGG